MARIVAAFGSSHSAMQMATLDNWLERFDHIDRKAPIYDFDGNARGYDELLAARPPEAAKLLSTSEIARRFADTEAAMDRMKEEIAGARLNALIVVGDDQKEIFKDASRPAIAVYYGETIRNGVAPKDIPSDNWYARAQARRMEEGREAHYPCHAALGRHLIEGLNARGFDLTAVQSLVDGQHEGHAYSFIHKRYLAGAMLPMVPIFLNTYYPPNQPTPKRCFELGRAIGALVASFPDDIRVGVLASGGLSHFLVNERLDARVMQALRDKDAAFLTGLDPKLLQSGTSEIRNWICALGACPDLAVSWMTYVPAYRSSALTGVGLCFASWR